MAILSGPSQQGLLYPPTWWLPPFLHSTVLASFPLSALIPQGRWQAAKYLREPAKTSSGAEDMALMRGDPAEERQPGHCSAPRGAGLPRLGGPRL